ncbi:semaphorin-4F isoform X1 [Sarcophilus harrisii]|uniref:Semaphorin-4F n=2 Tax=Sarcophilus harrisii TaxID=9305 RepID=G3WVI1_SARHA|nr:semaphorin-4F isoform X1 [Sarcophilus harrisii]
MGMRVSPARPRPGRLRPRAAAAAPASGGAAPCPALRVQVLVLLASCAAAGAWGEPRLGRLPSSVPRTSLTASESDPFLTRFSAPSTQNYSVLLVDPVSNTLYVGAQDAIFALPLPLTEGRTQKIDWPVPEAHRQTCRKKGKKEADCHNYIRILAMVNASHLLTCGTFAFDPQCGIIDVSSFHQVERLESGRGKCPFEPTQRSAAVMTGGVLYTASMNNFLGTEPIISRATGPAEERIRTEVSPAWLNVPKFVAAISLSPADWGEEDGDNEIYFFFTETARDSDVYQPVKVPRVARVCAGDLGGLKTLQRRWTTFLKAELLCPGLTHGRISSILQDMTALRLKPGKGVPLFYGVFSSQWDGVAISSICAFHPQDIRSSMSGPFREFKHDCNRGVPVMDSDVPHPRPGMCITNQMKLQGFGSSLSLPDRVLTFVRDHPLMDQPVYPADGQPLLMTSDTVYHRIAAHRVTSLLGEEYDVLYLGTGNGHLHRAVRIGSHLSILEDLTLFLEPQPVETLQLHDGWLLIGSGSEVTQVNITNCGRFRSCRECILARDPACAWSSRLKACVAHIGAGEGLLQDIELGNASSLCPKEPGAPPVILEVPVVPAAHVVLPCSPRSAWATCVWHRPGGLIENAVIPRLDGLEVLVTQGSLGTYACECQEGGTTQVVATYHLFWGEPQGRGRIVGSGLAGFILGAVASTLILLLLGRQRQRHRQQELLARNKVGLDLGAPPSGTTSCSHDPPSPSPSPEDERLPLALAVGKRGSSLNGFPPSFLRDSHSGPNQAHILLTTAPLATCDETSI